MPLHPDENQNFDLQVAGILQLLGYDVQRDVLVQGQHIDILATLAEGFLKLRVAVECLSHAKPAGIERVKSALATNASIASIDLTMIVSRSGFTRMAKAAAADIGSGIRAVSFEDLLAGLIDFRPYLHSSLEATRSTGLLESYVALRLQDEHGAILDAEKAVRAWLNQTDSPVLLLQGEAGCGKTTFCRVLCNSLTQERIASGDSAIPFLIPLRDFRQGSTIEQFIAQYFAQTLVKAFPIQAFWAMLRVQSFVFVFDGLDECKSADSFAYELDRLLAQSTGAIKCIVTSRPYASSHLSKTQVLSFMPFSSDQIREYLGKSQGSDGELVFRWIREVYDLSALASQPMLLQMIVDTASVARDLPLQMSAATLYEVYTNAWLHRERGKGEHSLSVTTLSQLIERLAFHLQSSSVTTITPRELDAVLRDEFDITATRDLDAVKIALRSCGFIVLQESGMIGFVHKSFQEYFAARYIYSLSDELATAQVDVSVGGVGRFLDELQASAHDEGDDNSATVGSDLAVFVDESEDRRQSEMREEVAHEMGTPLAIIANGFSQFLRELPEDVKENNRDTIGSVRTGIDRMRRLIDRIGMLSATRRVDKSVFDIVGAARQVAQETVAALQWDGKLRFTSDSAIAQIEADEVQIRHLVRNLSENAIHAMGSSGTLSIEVDGRGTDVQIRVTDTGSGIADSILQHVFKPYFSTRKIAGGIGLGLSIVRGIVVGHEGTVTVESSSPDGTTFQVVLPMGELSDDSD